MYDTVADNYLREIVCLAVYMCGVCIASRAEQDVSGEAPVRDSFALARVICIHMRCAMLGAQLADIRAAVVCRA